MQASETQEFFKVWDQCSEMYSKPKLQSGVKALTFKLLSGYRLSEIKQGLQRHMSDPDQGQYMPKVADVVRQIRLHSLNQFPGAEEAWAKFPRDESLSACICDEMAIAWGVAKEQDEITGRMAFKETYNRAVAKAQAEGKQPRWFITCGYDKQHREQVVLQAVHDRLITAEAVRTHLPHIPLGNLQQLAGHKITASKLLENHAQTVASMDELLLANPGEALATVESSKAHIAGILQSLNTVPDSAQKTEPANDTEAFKAQVQQELKSMKRLHRFAR